MTSSPLSFDLDASSSSIMTSSEHCACCSSSAASSQTSPKTPSSAASTGLGSRIRKRMSRMSEKFSICDLLAREEQQQLAEEIKICKSYVKSLEKYDKQLKKSVKKSQRCARHNTRSLTLSEEQHSTIEEDVSMRHPPRQLSQSECLSSIRRGHPLMMSLQLPGY